MAGLVPNGMADAKRVDRRLEAMVAGRSLSPLTLHHLLLLHITDSGLRSLQQHQTLAAVRAYPGLTGQELAQASGICRYTLGRRLSEVEELGWIRRAEARTCSVTGRKALTWEAVK